MLNVIPAEPLPLKYTSTGFLPSIAIHERNGIYHHESSYSHFVVALISTALAGITLLWPVATKTFPIELRLIIAGGFLWAGFCGMMPYFIRNRFGQYITLDSHKRMVSIQDGAMRSSAVNFILNPISDAFCIRPTNEPVDIPFENVVAIQLTGKGPYQANLVYKLGDEIKRHPLAQDAFYSHIAKIVSAYARIGPFPRIPNND